MSQRLTLWLVPVIIYTVFFLWYTELGGPLSGEEIESFTADMAAFGSDPETIALLEKFAREDSGRQFLMLNAIDYNENPPEVPGSEPGESAQELMGRYTAHVFPAIFSRAGHPVFMGPAVNRSMDIVGIENAENWDAGVLMRYRSRRSFLEMVTNPVFHDKHVFKVAALDKTIAYPIEAGLHLGDLRLILGLVLLALTATIDGWLMGRKLARQQSQKQE